MMPYITPERREKIDQAGHLNFPWATAGDANYFFTRGALSYIESHGNNYQTYNDLIGALQGCQMELYRRLVVDYENSKAEQNGDVYP